MYSPARTVSFGILMVFLCYEAKVDSAESTALVGGRLIDGYGHQPIPNSVILIKDGVIEKIGTLVTLPVPNGYDVVSTEGMDVLPGLWDNHTHLMLNGHSDYKHWDIAYMDRLADEIMPASAVQLLLAGITSAGDLGAPLVATVSVKNRIENSDIPGPNLYVSGPFLQHEAYPRTERFRWGGTGLTMQNAKLINLPTPV